MTAIGYETSLKIMLVLFSFSTSLRGIMSEKTQNQVREIADFHTDYTNWYTDVVLKAGLSDYGPVRGTMVIRPYGYAVWENIQRELDARIKETGHKNAYFPLFIPQSLMDKEAEHVEGFAPECATVTHIGSEELPEKLIVRPTSEAVICQMYSKWVQSYRDLPLLLNQWANVVRWEKNTRPFLRTTEFLWQEGHTVHATEEEAREETLKMLHVYEEFSRNVLAIPMLIGRKSEKEKFAGAQETYSIEAMMQDGKSLQSGTTHYFGQNFSKAFEIRFLDADGRHKYAYQTSWGVTTRLIGAIIMTHGDERGLVFPPMVAPVQVIIVPIAAKKEGVTEKAKEILKALGEKGIRTEADFSDASPGWKFAEWEMKGVPVRVEVGPRDLEAGVVTVVRRDTMEKKTVELENLNAFVSELLTEVQTAMYEKAENFLHSRIKSAKTLEELEKAVENGFALSGWCESRACEDKIKERFAASTRNIPFNFKLNKDEKCVCCGSKATTKIYFGKAY
jgi:prolyl-tRNA synthetase